MGWGLPYNLVGIYYEGAITNLKDNLIYYLNEFVKIYIGISGEENFR